MGGWIIHTSVVSSSSTVEIKAAEAKIDAILADERVGSAQRQLQYAEAWGDVEGMIQAQRELDQAMEQAEFAFHYAKTTKNQSNQMDEDAIWGLFVVVILLWLFIVTPVVLVIESRVIAGRVRHSILNDWKDVKQVDLSGSHLLTSIYIIYGHDTLGEKVIAKLRSSGIRQAIADVETGVPMSAELVYFRGRYIPVNLPSRDNS